MKSALRDGLHESIGGHARADMKNLLFAGRKRMILLAETTGSSLNCKRKLLILVLTIFRCQRISLRTLLGGGHCK